MRRREAPIVGKDKNKAKVASPVSPPKEQLSPSSVSSRKKSTRRDSSGSVDTFEARRSTRVAANKYCHDGDSWQETLAVCEMPATKNGEIKMKIRSYYSNQRTGDRVWDEPPSGASKILPATEEMRKMAELQLQDMQITFGAIPSPAGKEKKRGFFRKVLSPSTTTQSSSDANVTLPKLKVKYKPGSILSKVKKEPPTKMDDSLDPEVQKAIALSMNDSGASASFFENDEPVIRSEVSFHDQDIEMVMALSLSEAESKKKNSQMSEDEMLQRALMESRETTSTSYVAAMPIKDEFSGLGLSQSSSSEETRRKRRSGEKVVSRSKSDDSSSLDKKMPAKPTKTSCACDKSDRKEAALKWDKSDRKESAVARSSSDGKKAAVTSRDSKSRSLSESSHSATRDTNNRKKETVNRDTKPYSSQSLSNGSSHSSLTNGKTDRQETAATTDSKPARSSQSTSSGSSRSSFSGGINDLSDRRMKDRKPSEDSSDSKLPTKPSPTAALKYGKSVRPPSSKNLSISRTFSSGSRTSLKAAREQAATKKAAVCGESLLKPTPPSEFSPYGDTVEAKPRGVSVKEYSNTRSHQRSLNKQLDKDEAATKESVVSGRPRPAGSHRGAKQVTAGKL